MEDSSARGARGEVALGQLYAWAVKAVPKTGNYGNEAYLRLWLGCARHQWCAQASTAPCVRAPCSGTDVRTILGMPGWPSIA